MSILIKNQIFNFGTKDGKPADTLSRKHSYVLQPVTGKAKYSKLHSSEVADSKQPLQTAVVNLDDVTISLSKDGYRDMMKLADNFATFNQRLKYAHFRPLVPVKADSRSWWKYAYRAIEKRRKVTYGKWEEYERSLASYIKKHACSNAKTEDLWAALEEGSGEPVNKLMTTWTKQQGYPVISVKVNNQNLEFDQSQFLSSGAQGEGQWIVPITLCFGSYDICNREKILSPSDRFGILDDTYALCNARKESLTSLLNLMAAYREEDDYTVLSNLISISSKVQNIAADAVPDLLDYFKQFSINVLQYSAERLGWDPKPGETHDDALLRGEILTSLAEFGHDLTLDEASRRFQAFLENRNTPLLPPDIRRAVYVAVMKRATKSNRSGYESLLKLYRETDLSQEKTRILGNEISSVKA
ncbi:AP-1 complex subunit mu-1-like [Lathyrus oleraceus]|uniref:AP-1 complex subunit mu-1-like n=1 Tax=Pisum sativum TaxID=3888 RepID=A0A9D4ZVL6_PEA|nr:AP-1 complex subunit mu-1-like [Pisum sativum]